MVATREILTDRRLKGLKSADPGKRYEVMDALVPGMGIRVTDKGMKTFILLARFPGGRKLPGSFVNPTRRALGEYGAITLDEARTKARAWHALIKSGVDPKEEAERHRAAEQQKRSNTFAVVAEDFFADKLPSERRGREVEQNVRTEFIPFWGRKAVTEITELDVLQLIRAKKKTAPGQARNLLGIAKRMFSWIVDQRSYGLQTSPCDQLRPSKIIGEKIVGDRVLGDDEIFALWRAARRLGHPHGDVYRVLTLTALRLNEVADASWAEIDLQQRLWVIPSSRMKGRAGKARAHAVPLTDEMIAILETFPRYKCPDAGIYVFSTTRGSKPVWMSDKAKKRLDASMLRILKAVARRRGSNPNDVKLPRWTNHDIRRTVRSNLSRLRVTEEAREALLAHSRPGIKGTYDHHDYLHEKREALELWAARLRTIVEKAPAKVIQFARAL